MQPSEEELRAAFEEQMRRITVEDVVVQTAVTMVNLAGRRLGLPGPQGEPPEEPDLDQAKLAIETIRALAPLLPPDVQTPVKDALSQLQMAFAQAAQGRGPAAEGAPRATPEGEPEPEPDADEPQAADEAERAKARSKIWTPPGT